MERPHFVVKISVISPLLQTPPTSTQVTYTWRRNANTAGICCEHPPQIHSFLCFLLIQYKRVIKDALLSLDAVITICFCAVRSAEGHGCASDNEAGVSPLGWSSGTSGVLCGRRLFACSHHAKGRTRQSLLRPRRLLISVVVSTTCACVSRGVRRQTDRSDFQWQDSNKNVSKGLGEH